MEVSHIAQIFTLKKSVKNRDFHVKFPVVKWKKTHFQIHNLQFQGT